MSNKLLEAKVAERFLDGVAEFLAVKMPGYEKLSVEALDQMEVVWLTIATNRKEFIKVMDKLKRTRKKSCVS